MHAYRWILALLLTIVTVTATAALTPLTAVTVATVDPRPQQQIYGLAACRGQLLVLTDYQQSAIHTLGTDGQYLGTRQIGFLKEPLCLACDELRITVCNQDRLRFHVFDHQLQQKVAYSVRRTAVGDYRYAAVCGQAAFVNGEGFVVATMNGCEELELLQKVAAGYLKGSQALHRVMDAEPGVWVMKADRVLLVDAAGALVGEWQLLNLPSVSGAVEAVTTDHQYLYAVARAGGQLVLYTYPLPI